jgi:hypothetical protein
MPLHIVRILSITLSVESSFLPARRLCTYYVQQALHLTLFGSLSKFGKKRLPLSNSATPVGSAWPHTKPNQNLVLRHSTQVFPACRPLSKKASQGLIREDPSKIRMFGVLVQVLQDPEDLDGLCSNGLRNSIRGLWASSGGQLIEHPSPSLTAKERVHVGWNARTILYVSYNTIRPVGE